MVSSLTMTNKEISTLLRHVAAVYLLTDENHFRVIAYERAADVIDHLNRELKDMWENGALQQVPGIGPSILDHLAEYFEKKDRSYLISVLKKIPAPVFTLMNLGGIGPKKAFKLVKALHFSDSHTAIKQLHEACLKNKVASIPTFGQKSQEEILRSIELHQRSSQKKERMPLPYAYELAAEIVDYLRLNPHVQKAEVVGSLRRMTATVGDIDIAVICSLLHAKDVIDYFVSGPFVSSVEEKGEKKAAILTSSGKRIDIRTVEKERYGAMLQYFTGSKEHNIKLREYAIKKGYSLSEYGIKKIKNKYKNTREHIFKNEKDFYEFLGLQYIPPEIREGTDEIERARKGKIPQLVTRADIRGDFHIHSSYNLEVSHDLGENSYEEIFNKAQELGYEYVGFADHNPSITNHSDAEIINLMKKRKEYIVQKSLFKKSKRLHFFISLEVDILPTGKIALPEETMSYIDFLIVSVHSSFRMSKADMTKRILTALQQPKVKILAHPTGRLLHKREEIEADWVRIFTECKRKHIAVEINSWPGRLDLPDEL